MRRTYLAWALILTCAGINLAVFWGYVVDDAYISFRYLDNWISGHGLVFNEGERLEAYSNLLWIVVLAPFRLAGVGALTASKWVGAAFFLLTIWISKRIIDTLHPEGRRGANFALPFLVAATPHLGFWATAGLETPAYAFLVCSSTYLGMSERPGGARTRLLPLSCLGLALCRPEGLGLAVVVYGFLVATVRPRRPVVLSAAVFFAGVMALLALRYGYYGELLPHTYYAKANTAAGQLPGALSYAFEALGSIGGPIVIVAFFLTVRSFRRRGLGLVTLVIAFYALFQIRFGWDWMPFYRFLTPYLPLVFVFPVIAGIRLFPDSRARLLIPGVLTLWMIAWSGHALKDGKVSAFWMPETHRHPYFQVAEALDEIAGSDDYVLYEEVGLIFYHSDVKCLDAIGLTDEFIGKTRYRNRKGDGDVKFRYFDLVSDHIAAKEPAVIILPSPVSPEDPRFEDSLAPTWPAPLYRTEWFRRDYEHHASIGSYHLFVKHGARSAQDADVVRHGASRG